MKDKFHVIAAIAINLVLMMIVFLNNNPLILLAVFLWCLIVGITFHKEKALKKGLVYFIPLSIVTGIINMFFVNSGNIVLIKIYTKIITLESFLFALIMVFKILLVIYLFIILEAMVDSDSAVSYFSSKIPKTTLMMVIAFKLIPNMKNRFKDLQDIYTIRGLEYKDKNIKKRIVNSVPLLSVLLEDSLEGAFDIAESAYVRGFLSGKRTIYDRQKLKFKDFLLILWSLLILIIYLIFSIKDKVTFEVYDSLRASSIFSIPAILIFGFIATITLFMVINHVYLNPFRED